MTQPFSLTPDQHAANRLLGGNATHILLRGGARSGKTFVLVRALVVRALRAAGTRHGIFRHRFNALRATIVVDTFPTVMRRCFPSVPWQLSRTDWSVTLPNGSLIMFGGLDDEERTEKILGLEFATVYLNEASQVTYGARNMLLTRLAQKSPLALKEYIDANPPTTAHWLYRVFESGIEPSSGQPLPDPACYATMQLNPEGNRANLSAEYLAQLAALPERERRRFVQGEYQQAVDGALWRLEDFRRAAAITPATSRHVGTQMRRIVVAVDPSGCAGPEDTRSDEIGIIVCGVDGAGALATVTECFKVTGAMLATQGWPIAADDATTIFWWLRVWDRADCHVYVPQRVDAGLPTRLDGTRSTHHGLGFVPWVWMANLAAPGTVDGPCTFAPAIDTVIECDYLLSQSGRGLKYSADPRLVIRAGPDPYADGTPASTGGASAALTLPLDGDAKLLEINGDAAGAMRDHYRELRASVMEQIHGNRAQADCLAAPTSGRAMEMLYQPLLWLVDRMVCAFSHMLEGGVHIGGQDYTRLDATGLALQWPPYFADTEAELAQLAQGLGAAVQGGFLSRQTACAIFATRAGGPAPHAEWARLNAADPT